MNRVLNRLEEHLVAVLMLAMTLLTFSQVVMRYGFNAGWIWSLEATTYMFGALLMIGVSYGMRVHAHLSVDAFLNVLSTPWKRRLSMLAVVCCCAYVILMIWGSYELVARLFRLGTKARDLPVQRWILMSILPIGFALFGLRLAQVTLEILRGQRDMLGKAHEEIDEKALLAGNEADPKVSA